MSKFNLFFYFSYFLLHQRFLEKKRKVHAAVIALNTKSVITKFCYKTFKMSNKMQIFISSKLGDHNDVRFIH